MQKKNAIHSHVRAARVFGSNVVTNVLFAGNLHKIRTHKEQKPESHEAEREREWAAAHSLMLVLARAQARAPRGVFTRAICSSSESKPTSSAAPSSSSSGSSSSSSSSSSESSGAPTKSDSIHSSDIAFKPNSDGWGYTRSYAKSWDRIFAKSKSETTVASTQAQAAPEEQEQVKRMQEKMAALEAARACGALSENLFAQAAAELKQGS
jgi:hypothetical protein